MRDHGGNLDEAMARFGGDRRQWLDLSTGINRAPYPVPPLSAASWRDLPTRSALAALQAAAQAAYATRAPLLPLSGAQAAIQLVPFLRPVGGRAAVLGPTYNEHAACLRSAGWQLDEVTDPADLAGADLAIVVNPNNPDGRILSPDQLLALREKVGLLVVDESFCDMTPGLSLAPLADRPGLLVLRSFGKFFGLAGLRLGFAIGAGALIARLSALAGPWPVSGAAIELGLRALQDADWAAQTRLRLAGDAARADALAQAAGWSLVGGTDLFRLYQTEDARSAQESLAAAQVWSRIFPYSGQWLRLGLPGDETEWAQLARAFGQARSPR